MNTFINDLKTLVSDDRGLTALDYGLTAGIVALAVIGSVAALGPRLSAAIATIVGALP